MAKKINKKPKKNIEDPGAMIQKIIEGGFTTYKGIFKVNLLRGVAFGLGSVLGATLIVGILAWLLSFFDNMLIVGDLVDAIQDSLGTQ